MVAAPALPGQNQSLAIAYAYCARLVQGHYENFPVASRLLPPQMRPHIAAIYAFARRADDFADEPGPDITTRLRLLDEWAERLDRGAPPQHIVAASAGDDLIFVALENTIRSCLLPRSLFHDLLSAFRQDVGTTRYATWNEVLDYCRRSANPVGRLVLRVAGYESPELDAQSDAVCTALQLTNFWQDLAIDWSRGRSYLPLEVRDRTRAQDADLDNGRVTPEWRAAIQQVTQDTRALFLAGRPVCDGVRGRLRWELRVTWLGGMRILEKTETTGFDVFTHRPSLSAADVPVLAWQAFRWKTGESSR